MQKVGQHLSHSQIEEFTRCPRRYHLHRRVGLKPQFCPSGLLFGVAMHSAVGVYHQLRLEGKEAGLPLLLKTFRAKWQSEDLPVKYKEDESPESFAALAKKMLRTYIDDQKGGAQVIAVEEPFRLHLSDDLPPIVGRIDLVEMEEGRLVLSDFKTASSRREPDPEQLVLYTHAAKELDFPCEDGAGARYVVLTKTKTPKVVRFDVEVTRQHTERLRALYQSAWKDIQRRCSFPRTGWWCDGCRWAKYCDQG